MTTQTWNSEGYANNARFVTDLGMPVLELLAPRPGEHILDLGCGDGVLTKKIADRGCKVLGIDTSADFVASASKLGLDVMEMSVYDMEFGPHFDAAFSNAALHWMKDPDGVIGRVARAQRSLRG
jgi:trans-aconitate methyltransferase